MNELKKVKKILLKKQSWRIFSENIVIEYNNSFYKCPNFAWKFIFYKWIDAYKFIHKSYKLLLNYFSNDFKVVNSKIIKDKKLIYIIKQEKINWRLLVKKDLKDKKIRKQVIKLLEINDFLWKKEWLFLDILWTDIISKPLTFHNIFINDWELYIFDFWLLNKKAHSRTFRFLSYLFYYLQNFWIKYILIWKYKL